MSAKIDKLTAAETRLLDEYVTERWAWGRSTAPADRPNAEAQVARMYDWLGKPRPYMVWVDGPWEGFLAQALLLPLILLDGEIDQLGSQLDSQLGSQLRSQLRSQLYSQLDSQLRSQLDSQLRSQLYSQLLWPWWGQFGSWWSFYDFPVRHMRRFKVPMELAERCDAWVQLSQSLGHWWGFGRIAILSERMSVCEVDDEGRLHSEHGPAIAYRDGTELWAIHGVRVDRRVVEAPEQLTVEEIRQQGNAEVRRVMVDRFGAERYLRESDAKLLAEDECGRLWRVPLGDDEPLVMVEVVNSTPEPKGVFEDMAEWAKQVVHKRGGPRAFHKVYWLRVPPDSRTPKAAVAWTFDVPTELYEPLVQT
jgi:hypothetical protein